MSKINYGKESQCSKSTAKKERRWCCSCTREDVGGCVFTAKRGIGDCALLIVTGNEFGGTINRLIRPLSGKIRSKVIDFRNFLCRSEGCEVTSASRPRV
jgi:hypothetical protein